MTTKRVTVYITSLVIDLLGGTEISPGQKIGISPDVVEPWEGALTFAFFPVLVAIAYWADRGAFDSIFAADKVRPLSRCGRVGYIKDIRRAPPFTANGVHRHMDGPHRRGRQSC